MKKLIVFFAVAGFFAACAPNEIDKPSMGSLPDFAALQVDAVPSSNPDMPYRVILQATNGGAMPIWNIDGKQAVGDYAFDAPLSGTYTVQLIGAANKGGMVMADTPRDVTFTIEQGLAETFLVGTWVWDKAVQGHWGNAPAGATAPSWNNANPNSQPAEMYDDVMTFSLDGTFDLQTQGKIYANEEPLKAGWWGDEYKTASASTVVPYTKPAGEKWEWHLQAASPYPILTFSGGSKPGAFPSYLPSAQDPSTINKYEIMTINGTTLWMRSMYSWGGWFYRFTHPAEAAE